LTLSIGIPMDDIHTPSVASGPTSNGYSNGVPKAQMSLSELAAEKDRLEGELSALSSVLDSHGVNMDTSLISFDGYPRADIDVPQIRTTRARIIHLRNDYKALMSRLEVAVQAQFAEAASRPTSVQTSSIPSFTLQSSQATSDTPFARVDTVEPGSPAQESGLRVNDQITRFGAATWLNHDKLSKVAEVVLQSQGRPINVFILRGSQSQQLILTPRQHWGGRGMLGCRLLPV